MAAHRFDELVEQIADVVRAWAGFRVALKAEGGHAGMRNALQGTVE